MSSPSKTILPHFLANSLLSLVFSHIRQSIWPLKNALHHSSEHSRFTLWPLINESILCFRFLSSWEKHDVKEATPSPINLWKIDFSNIDFLDTGHLGCFFGVVIFSQLSYKCTIFVIFIILTKKSLEILLKKINRENSMKWPNGWVMTWVSVLTFDEVLGGFCRQFYILSWQQFWQDFHWKSWLRSNKGHFR